MFPYSYDYDMYDGFSRMSPGSCFSSLIFWGLTIAGLWILFNKAKENGWAAIVPCYNLYVLFKITWGNGWMFLLLLIPVANAVIWIITMVKLSKAFGKGGGWACGLIFLPPIFLCIMAFSKDIDYVGVPNKTADYGNGYGQQGYQNPYAQGYQQAGYQATNQQTGYQAPNQQQNNYQQQSPQNNQYYYQQQPQQEQPQDQPQDQAQEHQETASAGEVKYCPSCGLRLENNEKFCPKCGKAQ